MQDFVGKQIDRYRITERLGMGGMAVVYKAYDTRLERDVALKLIRTESIPQDQHDRLLKRFEREAKSQARFSHPNIVSVHDYGEINGAPYLVMEFIPGGTLKDRIKGPINYRQALEWLIPIADALQYAHEQHIIHRDIKPSNILFDKKDNPILTDFGIAKILETDETSLTGTGLGVGTPEYMAPEQWVGKPTEASDQYAQGVVLYEMITSQKPYSADTPVAIALIQASEPLRAPSHLVHDIPGKVEKVVFKALERAQGDRFEDMDAFQSAMLTVLLGKGAYNSTLPEPGIRVASSGRGHKNQHLDSEAKTVDRWEPTAGGKKPAYKSTRTGQKTSPGKKRFPRWLLWGGVPAIIILVLGILWLSGWGEGLLAGVGLGKKSQDVPTQVSEGIEPSETPTEEASPTTSATSTATLTATSNPTVTLTPTVTPTPLPEGYFIMPDFSAEGVEYTLNFLEENELHFKLDVSEGNEGGKIFNQIPEPGSIHHQDEKISVELTGVVNYIFSGSYFAYDWLPASAAEVSEVVREINVNAGDVLYIEPALGCYCNYSSGHGESISKQGNNCSFSYDMDGEYNPDSIYLISTTGQIKFSGKCHASSSGCGPSKGFNLHTYACGVTFTIYKLN